MSTGENLIPSLPPNKFDKIKQAYEKTIPEKIELLTNSVRSVQEHPDQEHVVELRNIVHKMGGSAGSYGYASISVLCKEKDAEIMERMALGEFSDTAWLESLNDFLFKIYQGFQVPFTVPSKRVDLPLENISRPRLYVIDEDIKFLELLGRIKDQFSIAIETEYDPQKALERLMSSDFNPSIVIVSQTFLTSPLSGFDLIKKVRSKNTSSLIHFGLFLDQDTIENRMTAVQLNIDYIFVKPISAYVLLKAVQDILKVDQTIALKVLVVDDDIDFCNYVTLVLTEVGINVRTIQDSSHLFKILEEYHPNILLLDLILPKYDGLDVLKTLRQDVAYRNLIVIVVTSSEEEKIRMDAYGKNADEILYKPIDKELLQKRIINLSQRQNSVVELLGSEEYTGLGNLAALKEAIRRSLKTAGSLEQHLVLFEIDHFVELQKLEAVVAKNLAISISNQLQWETDRHMKCFSYQSLFAVIFDSQSMPIIEKKIGDFLLNIIQSEHQLHPVFNCSIVPISLNLGNSDQILGAAEQGLREAGNKDPAPVRFVKVNLKNEFVLKKEVVIIDSDQELLKILKNAFESHGVIVNTYTEGGEALKVLLSYTENRLPALIIAERKLPDMDGMDVYVKLKERFRVNIPFYVLTIFASDKDVSDGIKQGIVEYIVKPFNISLLMQKALKTVFKS